MRARLKTAEQDVWQLTVYEPSAMPSWVRACTVIHDDGLYLVRGADKQRVERTDWLLRDLDGAPVWYPDHDFQRQYEMVQSR